MEDSQAMAFGSEEESASQEDEVDEDENKV